MAQTAVEWFEQQLDNLDVEIPQSIFEQAKEMEKKQIIDAFDAGFTDNSIYTNPKITETEQYYKQTFNKQ